VLRICLLVSDRYIFLKAIPEQGLAELIHSTEDTLVQVLVEKIWALKFRDHLGGFLGDNP